MVELPFRRLIWLIPVFFILHNMEEALSMESWVRENLTNFLFSVPEGIKPFLEITSGQFWAATVILDIIVITITFFAAKSQINGLAFKLLLYIQASIGLNAFSHIFVSLRTASLQPGTITAALIHIPFSIYFFKRLLRHNYIISKQLVHVFTAALILTPVLAGAALMIGKVISNYF